MATPENILSDPTHALWGPIIANVWWGIPFFAITLLAALQSIPRDIYEAAAIDGAGPFQRFRSITLPFLAPTIAITILLRTVWIANAADLHRRHDQGRPGRFAPRSWRATSSPRPSSGSISAMPRRSRPCCSCCCSPMPLPCVALRQPAHRPS